MIEPIEPIPRMISRQQQSAARGLKLLMQIAPWLLILGVTGCAQVDKLKARVSDSLGPQRTVKFTPAPRPADTRSSTATSLASIVNDQLQHGHYAEGEKALRRYLARHPDNSTAKSLLHQLIVDPVRQLGSRWYPHQVQAGDSYSSLAAHDLGDSGLFLILARYNGSTNPSILRVGEMLRLPVSARQQLASSNGTENDKGSATVAAKDASIDDASAAPSADRPPANESARAKARRLQEESLSLLKRGHKPQALAQLDQALMIDPQLKPSGAGAASLRKQLLDSYHQRAIVLYRDQHLNQAIALWDRILTIDPQFEPAVIYRARALELKRRLRQL